MILFYRIVRSWVITSVLIYGATFFFFFMFAVALECIYNRSCLSVYEYMLP